MSSKARIFCQLLDPKTTDEKLELLAECSLRLTPKIATRKKGEHRAIFLDAPRVHNPHGAMIPQSSLGARAQVLAERKLEIQTAASAWGESASHAFTRSISGIGSIDELPLKFLNAFVDPFGLKEEDETFQRTLKRLIEKMRSLGVTRVGDFLKLPTSSLSSRFGSDGVLIRQIAEAPEQLLWPRFEPKVEIEETQDLHDWGILEHLEPLLFVLRPLFDRLFLRLHARSLRLAELKLTLALPQGEKREINLAFSIPQSSWQGVLPILRERLDFEWRNRPLEAEVRSLNIKVTHTSPGGGAQRDFFDQKELKAEAWQSLFSRLIARLGSGAAFVARPEERHLPEAAWSATEPHEPPVWNTHSQPDVELCVRRPTRLLRHPTPLLWHRSEDQEYLIDPKHRRRWRVFQWDEPEPLSGEWWRATSMVGFNRTYQRVETFEGEALWVFRQESRELYLHGYFD